MFINVLSPQRNIEIIVYMSYFKVLISVMKDKNK